jgi:hypothetical protein
VKVASGSEHWEKVTFEGHQALKLLKVDETDGKMAIQRIMEAMWPSGDVESYDKDSGEGYVKRSVLLWKQWAVVVALMTERDPAKLRRVDGFEMFGKECREFCFRYQSMFLEAHCRSYYLHTLLHHAGDFMRELEEAGMCLGMMSNSGAERRHEYGRRAARKALASGCWRNKMRDAAGNRVEPMQNLLSYITLKEIMIWQYGRDLISHELARRVAYNTTSCGDDRPNDTKPSFDAIQARRKLLDNLSTDSDLLLSRSELEHEFSDAAADDSKEQVKFESKTVSIGKKSRSGWEEIRPGVTALVAVTQCESVTAENSSQTQSTELRLMGTVDPENESDLFCGRQRNYDAMSEISADGSDDGDDDWAAYQDGIQDCKGDNTNN